MKQDNIILEIKNDLNDIISAVNNIITYCDHQNTLNRDIQKMFRDVNIAVTGINKRVQLLELKISDNGECGHA